ncbi:MAG: hypothetical protein R3E64_17595 [Halioglobus sp.]
MTTSICPPPGEEEDGLPVQTWQQGADFIGGEVELRYDFEPGKYGHWRVFGFGDIVDGELSDNNDVPLAPPARIGMGLDWDRKFCRLPTVDTCLQAGQSRAAGNTHTQL